MMPTGWCPGDRSVTGMLAAYPETSCVRIFFGPGDGLPASAWTDTRLRLAQVPAHADVIVSHKDPDVDAAAFVAAWQATGRTGRLILVPHHEPEQQSGGDPPPATFRRSWTRTREQVGDHPARHDGRLLLAVCWTLQWVRRVDAAGRRVNDWRTWWPTHEADAVDLVLGDWYPYDPTARNPFRPAAYEDPAAALTVMTELSAETGSPWGIAEINHSRITKAGGFGVDLDPDGSRCADWYRRMHAWARDNGCQVWAHFHRGGGDLTERPAEARVLRELIAQEAAAPRRLAPALETLRGEIERRWPGPGRVLTDSGHHADHRPNVRGAVDAIDVDVAGLDVEALLAAFTRHPAAGAWVHAGRGARADDGWTIRPYAGTNPGERRLHLALRPTAEAEQDRGPWLLAGDDGTDAGRLLSLLRDPAVAAQLRALPWQYTGAGLPRGMSALDVLHELLLTVRALGEIVAEQSPDPARVRAALAPPRGTPTRSPPRRPPRTPDRPLPSGAEETRRPSRTPTSTTR
ncbi:hypothetical protein [Micromonospora olivasterospora]|uniref:Uncharacterized protein n=1 Tax=Micromonospora olivasterospora TaxID=1880 RepID=A0A562II77_MICOL|nr:hypothetical protein [Micromonospora olivasterospora]TWH70528.1 hypothetical protein JD77_05553 [Micromonospora olivasterospora]